MFNNAFDGKKVLVTGHTGFKGTWMTLWLQQMGAEVVGISDRIPTDPSHFEAAGLGETMTTHWMDIRDTEAVPQAIAAPAGCETCHGTGYQGRLGVFEMIEVGEALRGAIDRGATEAEMAALALKEAETLIGQGLAEVAAGETSLSEVLRVVGDVA